MYLYFNGLEKEAKSVVFSESCGVVKRSKTYFLCSFGAEKVKTSSLFRNPALKAIRVDAFYASIWVVPRLYNRPIHFYDGAIFLFAPNSGKGERK